MTETLSGIEHRVLRHREELLAGRHVAAADPDGRVVQVLGSTGEDASMDQIADVGFGDAAVAEDIVGARVVGNDLVEHTRQAGTVELKQQLSHCRTVSLAELGGH